MKELRYCRCGTAVNGRSYQCSACRAGTRRRSLYHIKTDRKAQRTMDERTSLKRQVDNYLKSLVPDVYVRKVWGGGTFGHEGDWDYVVCAWGRYVEIELKHPVKKSDLSRAQVYHGERIKRAGALTIVAHSVVDVVDGLNAIESRYAPG